MPLKRFLLCLSGVAVLGLWVASCDFPYEPEIQAPPNPIDTTQKTTSTIISGINKTRQICNPSISQDNVNYPGCMLWLNFDGTLVTNPPLSGNYTTSGVKQHDRLTISDTSNTVKWFIMRDQLNVQGELQDPEWSTSPDYIACLGNEDANGNDQFSGYCIRLSTKKNLKFNNKGMNGTATPHIWIKPGNRSIDTSKVINPIYDQNGFIDKNSIKSFFGTDSVKIAYAKKELGILTLYYIDYSTDQPQSIRLPKEIGKEQWHCESPLISDDGSWITYNAYESVKLFVPYAQKLSAGSKPYQVAPKGSDPHWWQDPESKQNYIIYSVSPANTVEEELTEPILETGSAGQTMVKRVNFSSAPGPLAFQMDTEATLLLNFPMRGGYSDDGKFLCTGYKYGYIVTFN